jgi:dinuclear metal center YbgI/SA1388 family protein
MATVEEIYGLINERAPFSIQLGFDNAGILVGHRAAKVDKILVALDITQAVIEEAISLQAELIVSHHPVIWDAPKTITDDSILGRKLLAMTEHKIAAICAHTNLDAVKNGVNDCLAAALNLCEVKQLHTDGTDFSGNEYGIGRIGQISIEMSLTEFAQQVKKSLSANGVRYVDAGKPVRRVAIGGGSCSNMVSDVLACGCDTFVTADVKYDTFLDAKALGLNLIDAGHYPTEQVVCPVLAGWLRSAFPTVTVFESAVHREVFAYL